MKRNSFANSEESVQNIGRVYVLPNEVWIKKSPSDHDAIYIQKSDGETPNAFFVFKVDIMANKISSVSRDVSALRFLGMSGNDTNPNYDHDSKMRELERLQKAGNRKYITCSDMIQMFKLDIVNQYNNAGIIDPNTEIYWP